MRRKRFKIKKINFRMALYFSILLVLIGISISIINILLYSQEVKDQVGNVTEQKMGLILGKIDTELSDITKFHSVLINDNAINTAFRNAAEDESDENVAILGELLQEHHLVEAKISSIIAIGTEGQIYSAIKNYPAYQRLSNDNEEFDYFVDNMMYTNFSVPNTFPLEYTSPTEIQKSNITMYGQYFDMDSFNLLGYLAINVKKSHIFYSMNIIARETFETTIVLDENDNLIYRIGSLQINDISELVDGQTLKIGNKKYTVFSQSLSNYSRWRVIGLLDEDYYKLRTRRLNLIIYFVLLFFTLVMVMISWMISKRITDPIREMVNSMREFQQNRWPMPLETDSQDEIKELIDGYNSMLTSFIALTDKIVHRHEENKEMELDLINTQIDLLEAQINPHFIHNTLNSMNYLAMKEENHELSQIIVSFNKLLRMSMAIDLDFITVGQEVENIKNYAQIQSVRFEDTFRISYDIDADAILAKMPKLILQPIVENSIVHGILPKKEIGNIKMEIRKLGDNLRVSIADDGVGISDYNLRNIDKKSEERLSKHIGIKNVKDRLSLYYGEDAVISIVSKEGEGTTVEFVIPYED